MPRRIAHPEPEFEQLVQWLESRGWTASNADGRLKVACPQSCQHEVYLPYMYPLGISAPVYRLTLEKYECLQEDSR